MNRFNGVVSIQIIRQVKPGFVAEVEVVMIVGEEVVKTATKRGCVIVELLRNEIILRLSRRVLSRRVSQCFLILVELFPRLISA